MLKFFRKYQKIFFAIVIFFIVISFAFFGSNAAVTNIKIDKDKKISKAIDGSTIYLSEIEMLSYFMKTDITDAYNQTNNAINLFNDGVIRKDILGSSIFKVLVEKYFDQIKPFLENNFDKIKNFKTYTHKYDSAISVKNLWSKYSPEILEKLIKVQSYNEVSVDYVNNLAQLYIEEARFPTNTLRNLLYFEENSKKNIQKDLRLYNENLTLFNNHGFTDWFGNDTLNLISQFVLNVAKKAKTENYSISYEEVISDISKNLKSALKEKDRGNFKEYYIRQLQILNLNEKLAHKTWKNVLLFRKYLKDVTNSIIVDNLTLNEMSKFASLKANITEYELPSEFQFKSFNEMIQFEMYLKATCNDNNLFSFKDLAEIETNYPQLVYKTYDLEVKETNLDKACLKIKIQDMYNWQLENENFKLITKNFPNIKYQTKKEDKVNELENLNLYLRDKIDDFSRKEIIKTSKNLIDIALNDDISKQISINIKSKNTKLPINIKKADEFLEKLEKTNKIENYSEDNNNYYQVSILKKHPEKKLITFKESLDEKIIDNILQKYLKENYENIKKKYSKFKNSDGSYKDFKNVKDMVAEIVFEESLNNLKSLPYIKDKSLNSLAKYRMYDFVNKNLNLLKEDKNNQINTDLQFKLHSNNKKIQRTEELSSFEKQIFSQKEKTFSDILVNDNGSITFYYLNNISEEIISNDKFDESKSKLNDEATKILISNFVKELKDKDLIVIPLRN
ncbi:MAG: hypothetical protein K1060chlam5_00520 [Candidatus Anoxychlamydiales bacterium]|nr:hypothetical protein [Candidatus Anoxychlamydiales bacterium]